MAGVRQTLTRSRISIRSSLGPGNRRHERFGPTGYETAALCRTTGRARHSSGDASKPSLQALPRPRAVRFVVQARARPTREMAEEVLHDRHPPDVLCDASYRRLKGTAGGVAFLAATIGDCRPSPAYRWSHNHTVRVDTTPLELFPSLHHHEARRVMANKAALEIAEIRSAARMPERGQDPRSK